MHAIPGTSYSSAGTATYSSPLLLGVLFVPLVWRPAPSDLPGDRLGLGTDLPDLGDRSVDALEERPVRLVPAAISQEAASLRVERTPASTSASMASLAWSSSRHVTTLLLAPPGSDGRPVR